MTDAEKKQLNDDYFLDYLTRTRGDIRGQNINCPFHDDKTPSATVYSDHLYCRGSCNRRYDLYDLIQLDTHCNFTEALKRAQELYGNGNSGGFRITPVTKKPQKPQEPEKITTVFSNYDRFTTLSEAARTHYHKRGLTDDTIRRFKLGEAPTGTDELFIGAGYPDNKIPYQEQYRYLLPTLYGDKVVYVTAEMSEEYRAKPECLSRKYGKPKGLIMPYWNEELLLNQNIPAVIWICEGIYDGLSLEQAGQRAIALIGTAYKRLILLLNKVIKERGRKCLPKIVIALDDDNAGKNAAEKLKQELDSLNIENIIAIPEIENDWNDILKYKGTAALKGVCEKMVQSFGMVQTGGASRNKDNKDTDNYISDSERMPDIRKYIEESRQRKPIDIGFPKLQRIISNSLHKGLIVLGAAPSAGKTALVEQIIHRLAVIGRTIIYFSLEMSTEELITRQVSRLTYEMGNGLTQNQITSGRVYDEGAGTYRNYNSEEEKTLQAAISDYELCAGKNIYTVEYLDKPGTIDNLKDDIKKIMDKAKPQEPPILVIDFLQMLISSDTKNNEFATATEIIRGLKSISTELNTCIFAISSTARGKYNSQGTEDFAKNSGDIEYAADTTLYLRQKLDTEEEQEAYNTGADDRKTILKVIKNRAGKRMTEVNLEYKAQFNHFREVEFFESDSNISGTGFKLDYSRKARRK